MSQLRNGSNCRCRPVSRFHALEEGWWNITAFHADNRTRQLAGWTQRLTLLLLPFLRTFSSLRLMCVCTFTHTGQSDKKLPSSCCITSWCGGSTLPCPGLPPWWLLCYKLQLPDSLLSRPEDDVRASSNNNALYFHACHQAAAMCTLLLLLLYLSCPMPKHSPLTIFEIKMYYY